MVNKTDYVELGLSCADVCTALDRGMNGRPAEELSQPVSEAIRQLTTLVGPAADMPGDSLTDLSIAGP